MIVLSPGRATGTDYGGGISIIFNDDVGPGLSSASIPAAQTRNPRKVVNFEDVSDPDPTGTPTLQLCQALAQTQLRRRGTMPHQMLARIWRKIAPLPESQFERCST